MARASDPVTAATERLRRSETFRALEAALGDRRALEVERLPSAAAAWVLGAVAKERGLTVVAVVPSESEALAWLEGAAVTRVAERAFYVPAAALSPFQEAEASLAVRAREAASLAAIASGEAEVVVLTPRALFRRVPMPEKLAGAVLGLRVGDEIAPDRLATRLVRYGYRPSELVTEVGAFAQRGGVFDLFSPDAELPVRLDFFGDEIESLKTFDPLTQRTTAHLESLRVLPMTLFPAGAGEQLELAAALRQACNPQPDSEAAARIRALEEGEPFAGWENYLPLVAETTNLAELLPQALWVAVDPDLLVAEAEHHRESLEHDFHGRRSGGRLAVEPDAVTTRLQEVVERLRSAPVRVGALETGTDRSLSRVDFGSSATEQMVGQLPRFAREVEIARERGERVLLVAPGAHHPRLAELLAGRGVALGAGGVELVEGELRRGYRLPAAGVAVYGEAQLLSRGLGARRPDRRRAFLGGLKDLRVGEYVVHEDHGIGRFAGMRMLSVGGDEGELPPALEDLRAQEVSAEVMEIVYADGRTLLLPVDRLGQIQRYSGIEGVAPKLDRLGGTSWNRKKSRIKRGLKKLATDLLALYAQRQLCRAPAAREDSDGQRQFEAAFRFDETEDQLAAAEAVKRDLENERPMDRLLVGDVGFGKTEVAMRAAFKMVDNGYQVAVLAPTTILAEQHRQTFQERFATFPVEIEMISRFRTAAEIREVRQRLADGRVDIVIGTHRLLGRDIEIPNLGLLIVDEEQRFGVGQKERLKELRKNIHVLAMSATPVPRTLQLSLAGVRDLSTIESPPKDRMAVDTRIVPFSAEMVREAIDFELERRGQVYYVYNRVEDIERISEWLRELVPGLSITVGHGQLEERELSRRMQAFKRGEIDLLLATTIIENGIDIPNVNTMIVHRADRFGLAQLYQLRGRVGRSNQLAFCYLLLPEDRVLSQVARKRLAALREFTELGAGFRIAARDLEIRGAGNLLGAEQSGHIAELGIETYLKMLDDTVRELRGQPLDEVPSAQIDLPVAATIPTDYVSEAGLRMEIYQRLARAEETSGLLDELRDRFGPPPEPVAALVRLAELKHLAEQLRVQKISMRNGALELRLRRDAQIDVEKLIALVSEHPEAAFSPDGVLRIGAVPGPECVSVARQTLQRLAAEAARPATPVTGGNGP